MTEMLYTDQMFERDWGVVLEEEIKDRGGVSIVPGVAENSENHLYVSFEIEDCKVKPLADIEVVYIRPAIMAIARELVEIGSFRIGPLPLMRQGDDIRSVTSKGRVPIRFTVERIIEQRTNGQNVKYDWSGYRFTFDTLVEKYVPCGDVTPLYHH